MVVSAIEGICSIMSKLRRKSRIWRRSSAQCLDVIPLVEQKEKRGVKSRVSWVQRIGPSMERGGKGRSSLTNDWCRECSCWTMSRIGRTLSITIWRRSSKRSQTRGTMRQSWMVSKGWCLKPTAGKACARKCSKTTKSWLRVSKLARKVTIALKSKSKTESSRWRFIGL